MFLLQLLRLVMIEVIKKANAEGRAIGHFNFAELTVLKAAVELVKELKVPIILGTSEGEREFVGVKEAVTLIKSYQREGLPVFLNADHTKSLEKIKEAVEAGYDAVLFDGSELPFEENIKKTREVVEWVKAKNSSVLVEGEIGYIGSGSIVREGVPEGIQLTSVEEAVRFVRETGVDLLAPAVGNIHGIIKGGEPSLNIERVREIKEAVKILLVLHGASGNSDEDVKAAIEAGVSIVHINTEVRLAWKEALDKPLHERPQELAPYKILNEAEAAAKAVIAKKVKLFYGLA